MTQPHVVTSVLEIWRFLSEAINTRLAYSANYSKKTVADATITGLLVLSEAERHLIERRTINEFVRCIFIM